MKWFFARNRTVPIEDAPHQPSNESDGANRNLSFAPLSIHPDPTYYVQSSKNPYSRIRKVIDVSDGGVLGVTGERGAGKSVLLNKLSDDYSKEFLTVNLAAPISSSREMEFFVMLFRHLTQRVINDLRRRAKQNREDIEAIGKAAILRERYRTITIAVATSALLLVLLIPFVQFLKVQATIADIRNELTPLSSDSYEEYDPESRYRRGHLDLPPTDLPSRDLPSRDLPSRDLPSNDLPSNDDLDRYIRSVLHSRSDESDSLAGIQKFISDRIATLDTRIAATPKAKANDKDVLEGERYQQLLDKLDSLKSAIAIRTSVLRRTKRDYKPI
jgi:hypothetical protein